LEADFQRFYGLDLVEAAHGPAQVGVRRLVALISNLPPESALARVYGTRSTWTNTDEMLAALLNVTVLHRFEWLRSLGVEVDEPTLVESPWAAPPEPPVLNTGSDLAAFLGAPITYAAGS
jgi:hypothetical protein